MKCCTNFLNQDSAQDGIKNRLRSAFRRGSQLRAVAVFVLIVSFVNTLIAPQSFAAGPTCRAIFETRKDGFDVDFFQQEKSRLQSALLHGNGDLITLTPTERAETILAFIEIRSDLSGFHFNMSEKPEILARRAQPWARAFAQAHGRGGGNKLQFTLMAIHAELHAPGWKGIAKSFLPHIESALASRIQSELIAHDLVTAFKNSGLVIDDVQGEKLAHRFYASGGINWATQLAFSALSPAIMGMVFPPGATSMAPPLIAGAKFEHLKKLTPQLSEKIRTQGWSAAQTEIYREFGRSAQASWAVNTATRVFVTACAVMLLQTLYDDLPWMTAFAKAIYESYRSDQANEKQNQNPIVEMNAEGIREQLVLSWREWYEKTNHRSPSDEEIQAAKARMNQISEQILIGSQSPEASSASGSSPLNVPRSSGT